MLTVRTEDRPTLHLSTLIDTIPTESGNLKRVCDLIVPGLDSLELRSTVQLDLAEKAGIVQTIGTLTRACSASNVECEVRIDGIDSTPRRCFAVYTSAVVDPFFNLRVCCMRAHLGTDDGAFLGSLFDVDLQDALATSVARMKDLGGKHCLSCSSRTRRFSEAVVTFGVKNGNDVSK